MKLSCNNRRKEANFITNQNFTYAELIAYVLYNLGPCTQHHIMNIIQCMEFAEQSGTYIPLNLISRKTYACYFGNPNSRHNKKQNVIVKGIVKLHSGTYHSKNALFTLTPAGKILGKKVHMRLGHYFCY